ncbi:MAG TPA: EAL domain-containing protein [Spirochaetota bacterium]|nr:EAL domain-containing protein [Spirochaetota bacterium]
MAKNEAGLIMREYDNITIEEILESELITTHFQPLLSFKRKQIIGFEALSRGINPVDNSLIPPQLLIEEAEQYGLALELDRLFRRKALENFSSYYRKNRNSVLSINLDSNAIKEGIGSKHLIKEVEKHNINPSSIIIEILESEVSDIESLGRFVSDYRKMGFMIALDDFGAGFSNWDRIVSLKPDLIKLDRSIINKIDGDFYRQEVARSIIKLSHNTGSIVIAEGIENENEALKVLELNADMLQGYLMGCPSPLQEIDTDIISERMNLVSAEFIRGRNLRIKNEEKEIQQHTELIDRIVFKLSSGERYLPEETLKEVLAKYRPIECAYILDDSGIQTSETVINSMIKKGGRSRIFQPDDSGSDQSNKDYFYSLFNGHTRYISEPYISTATGNMCITFSKRYIDPEGNNRILCVDIKK